MFGILSIAWIGGTFWIRAREPVTTSALPASFPGRVIPVDGHDIRILEQGAGPAVLLVAGIGGSVASWPDSFLERLAVDHRVVAVDLYGMGFSARSDDFTYGFALWSQQLVSVLDALGIARASVVGHSLGGTVAIFFAANHPHRVDRVVLAGSAISFPWSFPLLIVPGPGELFLAYHEVFGPTFSAGQRAQAMAAYRIRGTRVALLRYVRHSLLEASGLSPAVAAVRAKVLQLHGTVDEEVPFSAAERLQTQLRDSRLVPFEGASHFLMFDVPERFASEVEMFLAAASGGGIPAAIGGAYERPGDCGDPFRLEEAGLGEPKYFGAADSSTVPLTLLDPLGSPSRQTPEPYFEGRFDSDSRLRIVTVYLDGPDHVLSYEYRGSKVVQHCRPVYRPPKPSVPRRPVEAPLR